MQEEGSAVDPQAELTSTKCLELFCESIPSSVLQTYALLGSADEVSATAVASIVSSAIAIAFASSTISLDFDIDPAKRTIAPQFYGYTPDVNRMLVFVIMTMMAAAHVLMKVLACSLMLRVNQTWFITYLTGDVGIYLLYKTLRGDIIYWFPLEGVFSLIVSFAVRIIVKPIADFTLILQFRHPFELSGIYWSLNLILQQLFCFIAVYVYFHNESGTGPGSGDLSSSPFRKLGEMGK